MCINASVAAGRVTSRLTEWNTVVSVMALRHSSVSVTAQRVSVGMWYIYQRTKNKKSAPTRGAKKIFGNISIALMKGNVNEYQKKINCRAEK